MAPHEARLAAIRHGYWGGDRGSFDYVARFQDGSPPPRLQKIDKVVDTRKALHAAAKLRVEELYDGFMQGFTQGNRQLDVPPGMGDPRVRH